MHSTETDEILIEEKKLSMRYFCKLLYQGKQLVFTGKKILQKFDVSISKIGFSFGGLLAYSIASNLWNLPYFNADILLKNVACIMFGPPCVSLPRIEDVYHCKFYFSIVPILLDINMHNCIFHVLLNIFIFHIFF